MTTFVFEKFGALKWSILYGKVLPFCRNPAQKCCGSKIKTNQILADARTVVFFSVV